MIDSILENERKIQKELSFATRNIFKFQEMGGIVFKLSLVWIGKVFKAFKKQKLGSHIKTLLGATKKIRRFILTVEKFSKTYFVAPIRLIPRGQSKFWAGIEIFSPSIFLAWLIRPIDLSFRDH